ncbi:MAG: TonB-dependent receptor [Gammaproteobacteria bacterium]|jgi:iron complex outermembrane receptor protein|nr:TonB-dependent receptor [Gammaproteobacteria bacterium]
MVRLSSLRPQGARFRVAGAVATALTLSSASAMAADADTDANGLEEIVVTARMREEKLIEVPISTTVLSSTEIADARVNNVADFVARSPNVSIVEAQNIGSSFMTIRGISQVRNGEPPVATVVDGVEIVNAAQFTQELVDIQQIEVLRGPQGAIYGRNASGGAIVITTKQPTNDFTGKVTAGGGNGDEKTMDGSLSGPIIADKLLFRVSARYVDRAGYIENISVGKPVDPYRDQSYRSLLKWLIDDGTTLDLRVNVDRVRDGANNYVYQAAILGPDGKSLAPGPFPFDFSPAGLNANRTDIPYTQRFLGYNSRNIEEVSAKLDHKFDFGTLTYIPSFNKIEEFLSTKQFPYTAGLSRNTLLGPVDGTSTQYSLVNAWSQELRLASPSNQKLQWLVGGYYLHTNRFISTSTGQDLGYALIPLEKSPAFGSATNPTLSWDADDNTNKAFAIFGNSSYDITDKLEAAVALRYDQDKRQQRVSRQQTGGAPGAINDVTFSKTQPKASLRYNVDDSLSVYGSWGVGFRSGQFNQNGTGAAAAQIGLPGVSDVLPAEETRTTEIGMKGEWLDRRLRVDASVFQTRQTNAPYFVFVGAITAQILVAIDRVDLRGGEFSVTGNLAPGLDAYIGYGYTHSEIKRYALTSADVGHRAPYVPNETVDAGLQYKFAISSALRMVARADYQRLGRQYWDPENSTARDPVNLTSGRLGLETLDGHWSLMGTINNATNRRYNAEWVGGGFAELAPPRNWVIEASYRF